MCSDSVAARGGEFRRGWKVLLSALLGTACGASPIPFQTMGFFIGPLQQEFGWSLRDISFGVTIYGVLGALLAPLFGSFADRYGVRPVALLSTAAFGLAFGALSLTPDSLAGFYSIWFLIGLVGIGSTPISWSRAVNLWFFRQRGIALGLTLAGTSVAALVLPILTVTLIASVGWRASYALLALLPLGIALPVALAWFREPCAAERLPELTAGADTSGAALPGSTLREAVRGPRFWLLVTSIVCVSFAYGGAFVHMPQMLKGHGFTGEQTSVVMSLLGLSIFAGRILTGVLLDRFWAPLVALPILCLPAVSCALLAGEAPTLVLAILAAVLLGFASGAETDLIAYLASRYFGMGHYGRIYGALYMAFGIASAAAPPIYGAVRDASGSYDPILFVAALLFVAGGLLLPVLGRYPDFAAVVPTRA